MLLRKTLLLLALALLVGCSAAEETPPAPDAVASAPEAAAPTATPAPPVIEDPDLPWWNDRIFYEIFVRSFYDSDGDGVGDLQGVIERLDYLNDGDPATTDDLGITGIWLMPIMESPSYHGYDIVDYYTVDREYGTNDDFKQLVAAAHERGIAVIIDMVYNHTSSQHPWFQQSLQPDSPYRDWYVWADTKPPTQGWHDRPGATGFYYGWFWGEMPDLNYDNPAVTEEMHAVTRFWLEEMGADGFRLDAIKHLIEVDGQLENTDATHDWLEGYREFYKSVSSDAVTVGEVWSATSEVAEYVADEDELDLVFEFDFAADIFGSVRQGFRDNIRAGHLRLLEAYPEGQYATFLTNHDQNRIMSALDGNVDKAKVAATLLLTSPGVPFIYYGEEIGMTGKKPDEKIRTPLHWANVDGAGFSSGTPWIEINRDLATVNIADQQADPASLWHHYNTLIDLRNAHSALLRGYLLPLEADNKNVYAFLRYDSGEALLVLVNLGREAAAGVTLTLAESPLRGDFKVETLFGSAGAASLSLDAAGGTAGYQPFAELPPLSSHILRLGQ